MYHAIAPAVESAVKVLQLGCRIAVPSNPPLSTTEPPRYEDYSKGPTPQSLPPDQHPNSHTNRGVTVQPCFTQPVSVSAGYSSLLPFGENNGQLHVSPYSGDGSLTDKRLSVNP